MFTAAAASLAAAPIVVPWFGFGWWFFIPLFWILLFGVVFAIFGRRWRYAASGRMNPSRQAEATLAERFAQGDIDEAEYRKRLQVLLANAPTRS
jgi:putative membrane protein